MSAKNRNSETDSTSAATQQHSHSRTVQSPEAQAAAVLGASTVAVHGGERRQKFAHALADPIVCTSTYSFESTQAVINFIEQAEDRGEYGRYGNPNEKTVERKLAALEGAEKALLYSSGMAALVGLMMSKLNAGDEVVFFDECYHRSREFCAKHLSRFGVVTRQVKTGDYAAMEAAVTSRTKMLISESPTNPHLTIVDLEKFVEIGRRKGVETLIDATLATPFNLQPIRFGVDYVLHSATKYLAGHNDLLAGVILGSQAKLAAVENLRGIMGAISSAHNCYLLQRGLKTFEIRMQRHNENGLAIARYLESHPAVRKVYYPGLESHPGHDVAVRTMKGFGGLITFELQNTDWKAAARVVDACKIFRIAPSLGGVESLIEQPLVMSYFKLPPEDRKKFGISDNMIRIAAGIENAVDLIRDLEQALAAANS